MKDFEKIDFIGDCIDEAFVECQKRHCKYWLLISNYYNKKFYKIYYSDNKEYLKKRSKYFSNIGLECHTNAY